MRRFIPNRVVRIITLMYTITFNKKGAFYTRITPVIDQISDTIVFIIVAIWISTKGTRKRGSNTGFELLNMIITIVG